MVSFEGFRYKSCYRSWEAVTSTVPWQFSGSLFNGVFTVQVFACAAHPGPQKAQPRGMRRWSLRSPSCATSGHPAHYITWCVRLSPSARCHWQPLTMKLCKGVSPNAIHVCSQCSCLMLIQQPSFPDPPRLFLFSWLFLQEKDWKIVVQNMCWLNFLHAQQWAHHCKEAIWERKHLCLIKFIKSGRSLFSSWYNKVSIGIY